MILRLLYYTVIIIIIMDSSSFFIENKALFGSYPNQDKVNILENEGVRWFVNLTNNNEHNTNVYHVSNKSHIIVFDICDRKPPNNMLFYSIFINNLIKIINSLCDGEKMYIHCRGGHGRSGMVVATILKIYFNMSIYEAIEKTNIYHRMRNGLSERWHKLTIPNFHQKRFIYRFFKPIYITDCSKNANYDLSFNTRIHGNIRIPNESDYMNGFIAFYIGKRMNDEEYCNKIVSAKTYPHIMKIAFEKEPSVLWDEAVKRGRIYNIIESKMDNHIFSFLNKGLGEIIYKTLDNEFIGEENVVGKCYEVIRYKYLYSITI